MHRSTEYCRQDGSLWPPLRIAALAIALAACNSPGHATVFGSDGRGPLPDRYRDLSDKMGLIVEARSQAGCTALCVGERTIATAAHCIFRTKGETAPRIEDLALTIGQGARRRTSKVATPIHGAENIETGSRDISIRPPIDATDDWALLRMDKPVCDRGWLPISEKTLDNVVEEGRKGNVYHVGYHGDRGAWELAFQGACEVGRELDGVDGETLARDFSSTTSLLLHKCDTGGGSSGSALLVDEDGTPSVAAINVGTYEQSRVMMSNGEVVHRYRSDTVANTAIAASMLRERIARFNALPVAAAHQEAPLRRHDVRSPKLATGTRKQRIER